jgi:hypothetical protein
MFLVTALLTGWTGTALFAVTLCAAAKRGDQVPALSRSER